MRKNADSISKVVPESIRAELDINTWDWAKELMIQSDYQSLMEKVMNMYFESIQRLQELAEENYTKKTRSVDIFQKLIKTQLSESLISYFSSHNILPKYGFPVDVVDLQVIDKESERIRLNRDLTMAISEYIRLSKKCTNFTEDAKMERL